MPTNLSFRFNEFYFYNDKCPCLCYWCFFHIQTRKLRRACKRKIVTSIRLLAIVHHPTTIIIRNYFLSEPRFLPAPKQENVPIAVLINFVMETLSKTAVSKSSRKQECMFLIHRLIRFQFQQPRIYSYYNGAYAHQHRPHCRAEHKPGIQDSGR